MDPTAILELRKQAEQAVSDMPEGSLKLKAFEVILAKLLSSGDEWPEPRTATLHPPAFTEAQPTTQSKRKLDKTPDSCPARILSLRDEGFFKTARSLAEIRNELQIHGWIYPVTSLSGPMQMLVQKRELRRMSGPDRGKSSYTYVAP